MEKIRQNKNPYQVIGISDRPGKHPEVEEEAHPAEGPLQEELRTQRSPAEGEGRGQQDLEPVGAFLIDWPWLHNQGDHSALTHTFNTLSTH